MKIGVIKEIKDKENRIALTPEGAKALTEAGHDVRIQEGGGLGSGFSDEDYVTAGAQMVLREEAWASELVLKVKEPIAVEYPYLDGQILFTYFHLAGVDPALTDALLEKNVTAVAYETVEGGRYYVAARGWPRRAPGQTCREKSDWPRRRLLRRRAG